MRVLRGVAKQYRGHTYTVRKIREDGEVVVDNGDPNGPDAMTNGASVMLVVRPNEIEPWPGTPRRTVAARLAVDLREALAEVDRLRARVAELEERSRWLWKCAAEAVIARGPEGAVEVERLRVRVAELEALVALYRERAAEWSTEWVEPPYDSVWRARRCRLCGVTSRHAPGAEILHLATCEYGGAA